MFTQTSKLFLPVAGAAAFLAAVYHVMTRDVMGGVLYLMVSAVAFLLGVMLSTVRENEYAPVVGADAPPPVVRPVIVRHDCEALQIGAIGAFAREHKHRRWIDAQPGQRGNGVLGPLPAHQPPEFPDKCNRLPDHPK